MAREVFITMPRRDYDAALERERLSTRRVSYRTRLTARQRYDDWTRQYMDEVYMARRRMGLPTGSAAEKRAMHLLRRHLSEEQWECLVLHGYFEVVGKVRKLGRWKTHRFRIHSYGTVYEHKPGGRWHYCLMALEPGLPECDWMLIVKMLIESDCRKFLATAKRRNWQGLEQFDA